MMMEYLFDYFSSALLLTSDYKGISFRQHFGYFFPGRFTNHFFKMFMPTESNLFDFIIRCARWVHAVGRLTVDEGKKF